MEGFIMFDVKMDQKIYDKLDEQGKEDYKKALKITEKSEASYQEIEWALDFFNKIYGADK